jgi:hypothetical protein
MKKETDLNNRYISENYQNISFWMMRSYVVGAFSYFAAFQYPLQCYPIEIDAAVNAFNEYISTYFKEVDMPQLFSYEQMNALIDSDRFEKIPAILALNKMQPDFIDLGALARNTFYMIIREVITQREFEKAADEAAEAIKE